MKDIELWKPGGVGLLAFITSYILESMNSITETALLLGRFLTGVAMIATAIYSIYKIYQDVRRTNQERKN